MRAGFLILILVRKGDCTAPCGVCKAELHIPPPVDLGTAQGAEHLGGGLLNVNGEHKI